MNGKRDILVSPKNVLISSFRLGINVMALKVEGLVDTWAASPPIMYFQLKEALNNPNSAFDDFAKIISTDPALTSRLLKIVNSAFYGLSSQVETISHALNIIGTNQLVDMALASAVTSTFRGIPRDLINMEAFWMHSVATGVAARKIGEYKKMEEADRFYLGGMLHDIGSLVLFKELPEKSKKVLEYCKKKNVSLSSVEIEAFGMNHAEVGGMILAGWNLPERIVEIVRYHHDPMESKKYFIEASIIQLADHMVHEMDIGKSGEPKVPNWLPMPKNWLTFQTRPLMK